MANIYDVAKAARVSIATVSAVINESAYVSPRLKRRVKAAIQELGYQPNLLARSLARKESHTLAMIVPNVANPFFPDVVRGAQDIAQEHGYSLLVASSDDDSEKEHSYLDLCLAKRVDGILLTKAPSRLNSDMKERLKGTKTPLVQVLRLIPGYKGDSVVADDKGAAYEGVSHLLRLGYRRIGVISGVPNVSTTRRRLAGYRKGLKDWGVRFDKSLVVSGDYGIGSGYTAGLDLLKLKPEAVFVSNYMMTVGFMKALKQYQMICPDDLAVVTCDDYPWLETFSPRLTTVQFPKQKLGEEAVRILIDRILKPSRPVQSVQLRHVLAIRDSCGYSIRSNDSRSETENRVDSGAKK